MPSDSTSLVAFQVVVQTPGGSEDTTGCLISRNVGQQQRNTYLLLVREFPQADAYIDIIPQMSRPIDSLVDEGAWEKYAYNCKQAQEMRHHFWSFTPQGGILTWNAKSLDARMSDVRAHVSKTCGPASLVGHTLVVCDEETSRAYNHVLCGNCSRRKHTFSAHEVGRDREGAPGRERFELICTVDSAEER